MAQTSQAFANGKTTFPTPYGDIGRMHDAPQVIGPRLKALRRALGFKTQQAFADELGIDKSTYNPWETGARALTFESACMIRRKWGIPLDYLFYGSNADLIPSRTLDRLRELQKTGRAA